MRFSLPYKIAIDMQRVLSAGVMNPLTEPADKARLALAWDKLEERKRILKGKPLVKAIDAKVKNKAPSIYQAPDISAAG